MPILAHAFKMLTIIKTFIRQRKTHSTIELKLKIISVICLDNRLGMKIFSFQDVIDWICWLLRARKKSLLKVWWGLNKEQMHKKFFLLLFVPEGKWALILKFFFLLSLCFGGNDEFFFEELKVYLLLFFWYESWLAIINKNKVFWGMNDKFMETLFFELKGKIRNFLRWK